jgi:hypothetical protein
MFFRYHTPYQTKRKGGSTVHRGSYSPNAMVSALSEAWSEGEEAQPGAFSRASYPLYFNLSLLPPQKPFRYFSSLITTLPK